MDGYGRMLCIIVTLTFDSSPIKGEGNMVGVVPLPCGFWIKSRMTGLGILWMPASTGNDGLLSPSDASDGR